MISTSSASLRSIPSLDTAIPHDRQDLAVALFKVSPGLFHYLNYLGYPVTGCLKVIFRGNLRKEYPLAT